MATADTDPRVAPSTMDPTKFHGLGPFYQGGSEYIADEYHAEHTFLDTILGGDGWTEVVTPQCASCGTHYAHGVLFRYEDGTLFSIGHTCAEEYFSQPSIASLKQYRANKRAATIKRREAGVQFLIEETPEAFALFEVYQNEPYDKVPYELRYFIRTYRDMVGSSKRYGGLTERQVAFANKLVEEAQAKLEARRAIEATPTVKLPVPVTDERITVTGTVLSVKWQDSDFGYNTGSLKMLVEDPRGFRLWGTVPSKIDSVYDEDGTFLRQIEKGDEVSFDATVTPSDDDAYFGFYKRPTKPTITPRRETE